MIVQYRFALTPKGNAPVSSYHLYGWLLERLPPHFGEAFHQSEDHPLSQYLYRDRDSGKLIWVLNLLTEELAQALAPVLEQGGGMVLRTGEAAFKPVHTETISSPERLIFGSGQEEDFGQRCTFTFHSVTSFRQNGRYVLFPQEQLILNSLIRRWEMVCPGYALRDEDAIAALLQGVRISDYRLRSARHWMKDVRIPGFQGSVTFFVRLPPPMMEVWRLLCRFAPYGGVGIKTALGMGGVSVDGGAKQGKQSPEQALLRTASHGKGGG